VTLKRSLRTIFDYGAKCSGVLKWHERRMQAGLTVLMYHRVLHDADCRDYPFPSTAMPESMFAQQVDWLAEHTKVLPVGSALDELGNSSAQPLVAITFDDGYWDNSALAAPILESRGLRATFFITTEFVRTGAPMWFDRAAAIIPATTDVVLECAAQEFEFAPPRLSDFNGNRIRSWVEALKTVDSARRAAFLGVVAGQFDDWSLRKLFTPMRPLDVRTLAEKGHEIGSHSVTHDILPLTDERKLDEELRASRSELQTWCESPITGFCYPNGSFDDRVVAAAAGAGYRYACTTTAPKQLRPADFHRVGRFDITRDRVTRHGDTFDLVAFRAEICGLRRLTRSRH
jgi:peptidoglycan/xylan/chitin deacetylase (PgdA/CDA1 family)